MGAAAEGAADEGGTRWFVERGDVVVAIVDALSTPGAPSRVEALGTWGMGKSALARAVEERAPAAALVVRVFSPTYRPDPATDWIHELLNNWDKFTLVLELFAGSREVEAFETLKQEIARARRDVIGKRAPEAFTANVTAGGEVVATGGGMIGSYYSNESAEALAARVRVHVPALIQKTAETLDTVTRWGGGVAVVVDEFDVLRDRDVGSWILELIRSLKRAVVLVTTRGECADELADFVAGARREELRLFTREETATYLRRRLGRADDALVDRVVTFSGGLPAAVALAGDVLSQRVRSGGDPSLADLAADASGAIESKLLATFVAEADPDVAKIVVRGRFARRLDEDVACYFLCGHRRDDAPSEIRDRAAAAMRRLRDYSFLERLPPVDDDDDAALPLYQLHEHIRRGVPPAPGTPLDIDEEAVHAELAAFYAQALEGYDEDRAGLTAYLQWYKYEQPAWQALVREWLYHSGQLLGPHRAAARLDFAAVFLEAFWWWGCYVPFEFCAKIADDWEQTQPEVDRSWAAWMRTLLSAYPLTHRKLDRGDLAKVEQAILGLRTAAGVAAGVPTQAADGDAETVRRGTVRRRVRAFTSLVLAHSYRFRSGKQRLAGGHYADALRYLETIGDPVAVAWTNFERAELALELHALSRDGQADAALAEARAFAHDAAAFVQGESDDDHELLANLHRLRADILAAAGATADEVLAPATTALTHAFVFLTIPAPPDSYTVTFYGEHRERLAERVLALAASDSAAVAALLPTLLERLAPVFGGTHPTNAASLEEALRRRDAVHLARLLTPPPPVPQTTVEDDPELFATAATLATVLVGSADELAAALAVS